MPHRAKTIVLDSWAVIAYLSDENSAVNIAEIIANAHDNKMSLKMSVINVGEVWYSFAKQTSESEADKVISELHELGIEFVDISWSLTRIAAFYMSKNRMSYADCFVAALAKQERAELVTGDKEFKQVGTDIKTNWV